ncbi:MAG: histidine kinase [Bacteroidota bacterium]
MKWHVLHLVVWLLGYVLLNLSDGTVGVFTAGTLAYCWASLYGTLLNALLFYAHSDFLLLKWLNRKRWHWYLLGTTILLLSISLLESYIDFIFVQYYPIAYEEAFFAFLRENLLIHTFLVLLPSLIYRFSVDWLKNKRQQQQLKEEKLAAELAFLKAQINPHFLFNTLNNLFGSAQQSGDERTASGIAKLADMMRYMLADSEAEWVSLQAEINYLENYISLQEMRFTADDTIAIRLKVNGDLGGLLIAPMLLIPFVENAFKHGISLRSPSFIDIVIDVDNRNLLFRVQNSRHSHTQLANNHSIGLKNVQERLQLLYPKRHHLEITETQEYFDIQLQIRLSL